MNDYGKAVRGGKEAKKLDNSILRYSRELPERVIAAERVLGRPTF
jgi:hypothetical protein